MQLPSLLWRARALTFRLDHVLFVLALTLLGALLPGSAQAQVALDWQRVAGAEACPDEASLRDVVITRVDPGLLVEGGVATRVLEGQVAPHGTGHRVHLRLREQSGQLLGERVLVDDAVDCVALTEATALSVALLVESAPPLPTAPSAPEPTAATSPTPEPPPAPPPVAARAPWQYTLAAGALGSIGLLPAARVHAFFELRAAPTPTYFFELALVALGSAEVRLGGDSLGSARFSATYALLSGCRTVARSGRLGLAGCAGLIAGTMRADGSGFSEQDYHRRALLLAGSARLAGEIVLFGPLSALGALGLGVPLVHTSFVALDTNGQPRELASTYPLFAALELGVGARF